MLLYALDFREMDYGIEECCSSYSAIGGFKLIHQERSLARLESTKHFQESSMTNEQIQRLILKSICRK